MPHMGRSDVARQRDALKAFAALRREPSLPMRANDDNARPMTPRAAMAILEAIDELTLEVRLLRRSMEKKLAALDDQLAAMVSAAEAEDTKIDSLIELVKKMVQPLGLTADQQAKLDKIMASVGDNADRIQAAIDANTPPAPAPAEPA